LRQKPKPRVAAAHAFSRHIESGARLRPYRPKKAAAKKLPKSSRLGKESFGSLKWDKDDRQSRRSLLGASSKENGFKSLEDDLQVE
jgi:hypothetical protein